MSFFLRTLHSITFNEYANTQRVCIRSQDIEYPVQPTPPVLRRQTPTPLILEYNQLDTQLL